MNLVSPPFAPDHDTVVGCTQSHHGIAGGCVAKFEKLFWHGARGVALRRGSWTGFHANGRRTRAKRACR
eukprot:8636950-Pyramimonas_sp.AAC.1